MEKNRNVNAILAIEKNFGIEELFNEVQEEYFKNGMSKEEFVMRMLTGELEGIFDDNIEAFMRKSKLKLLNENNMEIADVKMTDFRAEDICYFIGDIAKYIAKISDEYAELFKILNIAGYEYSKNGYILPNLLYIDEFNVSSGSIADMNITFDAIISAAKLYTDAEGTSRVMIAFFPENEILRKVLLDKYFMSVGNSGLMLGIVETEHIKFSGYTPFVSPKCM